MTDNLLSVVHIQKLGHTIEEIRVRALISILSKYELQLVDETNLENTKHLLEKLLDWFTFDSYPKEEKVLHLIRKLLSTRYIDAVLMQCNLDHILLQLDSIEEKLNPSSKTLLKDVVDSIKLQKNKYTQDDAYGVNGNIEIIDLDAETSRNLVENQGNEYLLSSNILNRQMSFCKLDEKSDDEISVEHDLKEKRSGTALSTDKQECKRFQYPWVTLAEIDKKVLTSLYNGLRYIDDKPSVLQSCYYFHDVLLNDFPPEMFVQRPLILQTFLELLNCEDDDIRMAVLSCLVNTVQNLYYRYNLLTDPAMSSHKLQSTVQIEDGPGSDTLSEGSKLNIDVICFEDEEDTFLQRHQMATNLLLSQILTESLKGLTKKRSLAEYMKLILLAKETIPFLGATIELSWRSDEEMCKKMCFIFSVMQESLSFHKTKHKTIYLLLLLLTLKIQHSLSVKMEEVETYFPRALQSELSASVSDVVIYLLYKNLHADILELVSKFVGPKETESLERFKQADKVCLSMKSAVKFLRCSKQRKKLEMLAAAEDALLSLEFGGDDGVVRQFVRVCLCQWGRNVTKEEDIVRLRVLIKLLAHGDGHVKETLYKELREEVQKRLAVGGGDHSTAGKLSFLYNTEVLREIICHGIPAQEPEVRTASQEILVLLLNSKGCVSAKVWNDIKEALVPCLPLLQSFTDKATPLGRCVCKMLDPDMAKALEIDLHHVLTGNLRLLFSKERLIREEAKNRLCWLLSKQEDAAEKLPKLGQLLGLDLANMCCVGPPKESPRPASCVPLYSSATLCDLVGMLTCKGAEPSVRRSALSQLTVLMEDPTLHSTFLEQNGLDVVIDIMSNCLVEKEFHNYADSVVPVISILKLLVGNNMPQRQYLSRRTDVLFCVLRGLLLFSGDMRFRRDASELLCLLLYADHVLPVPSDRALKFNISLPDVIVTNMNLPLHCHVYWRNSIHLEPTLRGAVMQSEACRRLVRVSWAVEWLGSVSGVLALTEDDLGTNMYGDCRAEDMILTKRDLALLKKASLSTAVQMHLYDVQNATTHETVLSALHHLQSLVMLASLVNDAEYMSRLPWVKTFTRFLTKPPRCLEDEQLLGILLQVLRLLLEACPAPELRSFLCDVVTSSSQCLPNILATLAQDEFGIKGRDWRRELVRLTQHLARNSTCEADKWKVPVRLVADNLSLKEGEQAYNVTYLDWTMSLLLDVTACWEWNISLDNGLVQELVVKVMEVVEAFHFTRETTASFMGAHIVRSGLMVLNHLAMDCHQFTKGWEQVWHHSLGRVRTHSHADFSWLPSLWFNRDPITRAASLQLTCAFVLTPAACDLLLDRLHIEFDHVWTGGFHVLLNSEECSQVREMAALMLSNLTSHGSRLDAREFLEHLNEADLYGQLAALVSTVKVLGTRPADPNVAEVTPSLVSAVCHFLLNNLLLDAAVVTGAVYQSRLLHSVIQCCSDVAEETWGYADVVRMYTGIVQVVSACVAQGGECYTAVVESQSFVNTLYRLMDLNLYRETSLYIAQLREKLWCQILDLFSLLLVGDKAEETQCSRDRGFHALDQAMTQTGLDAWASSLYLALLSRSDLRNSCMVFLTNFLRPQVADLYQRHVSMEALECLKRQRNPKGYEVPDNIAPDFGSRACDVLLQLHGVSEKGDTQSIASNALASLLAVSRVAQDWALKQGLVESISTSIKCINTRLTVETVDSLRKLSTRKKLDPSLLELLDLYRLLRNFLLNNLPVKAAVAVSGISHLTQNLWPWLVARPPLLTDTLRMLCTYTHSSTPACVSLATHSTGVRKAAGTSTVVHCTIQQTTREMDLISKTHSPELLGLCLNLLANSCTVSECRAIIAKSQMLQCLTRLHPGVLAKKQDRSEETLVLWFRFLNVFTSHSEGQLALPKMHEVLEVVLLIGNSAKSEHRLLALTVLRNLCFHRSNRLCLMTCPFLTLIMNVLDQRSAEEVDQAATMLWALAHGSHKTKLLLKNAGLDAKLTAARRRMDNTDLVDRALQVLRNK